MIKPQTTTERRKSPRHRVLYRMDVTDAAKKYFGCLLDVSSSGMRIQASEDTDVLSVTKLRIELPQWLEMGDAIRVEGRFVWCKSKAAGKLEAGFSFNTLSEREQVALDQLIDRLSLAAEEDGLDSIS